MRKRYLILDSEIFSKFKDECKINFPKKKLQIQNEKYPFIKDANKIKL